jgi:hypothetical protein
LYYENVFDEVRRRLLFSILRNRNNPKPSLENIIKIYDNREIKIKLDAISTQPIKMNKGVRQGCPFHRLYLTYTYIILLQTGKLRR